DSKAISRAARTVGEMQYLTSPRARKKIEHRYNDYLAIAKPIAEERGITLPSAKYLTRENYIQKPISSIAPALIASADEKQFMGFLDISGVEEAEAAYRANTGLVLCSMHHSAMGVAVGYLAR